MAILDDAATDLSRQQFGVLARGQLLRGSTAKRIDGLVERGSLFPLQRGVYRVAGGAVLPRQAPFAAALRCGTGATISGPFVLGFLRVDGFDERGAFEILLPPGRRVQGIAFTTRRDPDPERAVIRVGEIRLVEPLDALLDSCRWRGQIPDRRLRLAYDWLRWRGSIDPDRVRHAVERRGADDVGARAFLDLMGGWQGLIPESEGERGLWPLLCRFAPPPAPQVWVTPRRRVDWYFADLRLAVEYQGSVDHQTDAGRQADGRRRDELQEVGIRTIEVRRGDLDDPEALAQRIAGAVAVRAAELEVDAPRYQLQRQRV